MRYALLDSCDPVRAATLFYGDAATLWLDSADTDHPSSRWSYLCIAPIATLQVRAEELSRGEDGFADRADEVRAWIRSTERQRIAEGPPFQGGAAGYVSYDAAPLFLERFQSRHMPRSDLIEFNLYDTLLAFDLEGQKTWVMSAGLRAANAEEDDALADAKIAEVLTRLGDTRRAPDVDVPLGWSRPDQAIDYIAAVKRTQDYILDGDIYQANIAQNWVASHCDVSSAFSNYLQMRERTPAPFAAFGHFQGRVLASASPERLISASATGRVVRLT